MREKSSETQACDQVKLIRAYLKVKIQEDNVTFRNHVEARKHVYDLIKNVVLHGESHSALVIGPRGSGKTTLINSVLHQLSKEADLTNDAIIVRLNGLIHHDEKVALRAITAQMQLENAVDGKVFGTFAEQLSFLLSCLTSDKDRRCRSMVFLLDECDLFCKLGKMQTLLYNLFDITHSQRAPMCVLGITNRIDVMELLEKRVKSRFSHRHIFIFPNELEGRTCLEHFRETFGTLLSVEDGDVMVEKKAISITNRIDVMELLEKRVKSRFSHRHIFMFPNELEGRTCLEHFRDILVHLLSVEVRREVKRRRRKSEVTEDQSQDSTAAIPQEVLSRCKMHPNDIAIEPQFAEDWNAHVKSLADNEKVVDAIEKFCYYTNNEQIFRNVLFQLVSKLSPSKPYIDPGDVITLIDKEVCPERRVRQIQSLSVLELSLLIAMLHGMEILNGQPLNLQMVVQRYEKFAQANSSTQSVPRAVIVKAFEHLVELELFVPARGQGEGKTVVAAHRPHWLGAAAADVRAAVSTARALPTEIPHWLGGIPL